MLIKRLLLLAGCLGLMTGCMTVSEDECTDECQACKYPAVGGYSPCCDPTVTRKAAKKCAKHALRGQACSDDFEDGFIAAYVDIASGASGVTPAVPPEKYWAAWYRSSAGHQLASDWFAGYEAGVESVRSRGLYQFNTVPTSAPPGMFRDNTHKTVAGEYNSGQYDTGQYDSGYDVQGEVIQQGISLEGNPAWPAVAPVQSGYPMAYPQNYHGQ